MNDQPKKKVIYIAQEDLKDRYKLPTCRIDRIRTYCKSIKSIGLATDLKIVVEKTELNNTIHITVTAHPQSPKKDFDKAVGYIVGEFIKGTCRGKYSDVKGISGSSKAKKMVDEGRQICLQNEGERCLPLKEEVLKRHDLLTCCELRQFRCPKCLSPFWRTVLHHKPVAPCKNCKITLCPLQRTEEFGIGRFICGNVNCNNVFYGRCQATDTRQCKDCHNDVKNPYIHPRFRPPYGKLPPGVRKPPSVTYHQVSKIHISTGSTISNFLRQWDETTDSESVIPNDDDDDDGQMPTIDFEQEEAQHGTGEDEGPEGSDSDSEIGSQDSDHRRRPQGSRPRGSQDGDNRNTGDSEDSD